jgi:hypothetical protein
MRRFLALSVATLASLSAGSCAPSSPASNAGPLPELAGRTAGAPQRCISFQQTEGLRIADAQTVIYGSGRTIWVNRLASACPGMNPMAILIVEPMGTEYCRGDRVRTIDPVSRIPGPACILGDFIPYRR